MRILLADDDWFVVDVLKSALVDQNYAVDALMDGHQAWEFGSTYTYDLILLDLKLPLIDGITLCQRFRQQGYHMPVLLLSEANTRADKIRGLDAGADDYMVKPVDIEELSARIRALLRRVNSNALPVLTWGALTLDPSSYKVTFAGCPVELTAKESTLLELFLRHSHHVFSIRAIIDNLWSSAEFPTEATVRSHLRRLRQKLRLSGADEDFIETVHGLGYRLKPLEQPQDPLPHNLSPSLNHSVPWQPWRHHDSLRILQYMLDTWDSDSQDPTVMAQALSATHTLSATLDIFGFEDGSQTARTLATHLHSHQSDKTDIELLYQDLACYFEPIPSQLSTSLVVIVGQDPFSHQLQQHFNPLPVLVPDLPTAHLTLQNCQDPCVCLINYPALSPNSLVPLTLTHLAPASIVVLIDPDDFRTRLTLARQGIQWIIKRPAQPEALLPLIDPLVHPITPRIMLVDTNTERLKQWQHHLPTWGFKVTTLDGPQQFWSVLQSVQPHAIVLELELLAISGLDLCRVLRSHPYWSHSPVLVLTTHQDPGIYHQVIQAGGDDCLVYPLTPADLAERIRLRLTRRQQFSWVPHPYSM